jgi:hypothetical protein
MVTLWTENQAFLKDIALGNAHSALRGTMSICTGKFTCATSGILVSFRELIASPLTRGTESGHSMAKVVALRSLTTAFPQIDIFNDVLGGADKVTGSNSGDITNSRGDNDGIAGSVGDDLVEGGENDTLDGGGANDALRSGTGDEALDGELGSHSLVGGAGNKAATTLRAPLDHCCTATGG